MLNLFASFLSLITLIGSPSPAQHHLDTGKRLFHSGDYPTAIVHLTTAIQTNPTAITLRDARHLLARAQAATGDHPKAIETFRDAIAGATGPEATRLLDVLNYQYGHSLAALGRYADASLAYGEVVAEVNSPHRAQAALRIAQMKDAAKKPLQALRSYERFLKRWPDAPEARDARLRLAQLLVKKGSKRRAVGLLSHIMRMAPKSRAGLQAVKEMAMLEKAGVQSARHDLPGRRANKIEWLMQDRRFEEALSPALKHLAWARQVKDGFEIQRSLYMLAKIYQETRQEAKALEIHAELRKRTGVAPTLKKRMRLLALSGQYEKAEALLDARHRGSKSRLYWLRIAEFRYRFGRYAAAFEAYKNAQSSRSKRKRKASKGKVRLNIQMAWCLIAMGQPERAIAYFKGKRARKLRDRMQYRYWYARALQVAGKRDEALAAYDTLASRGRFKYYGILAYSRALEMRGKAPGFKKPVEKTELLAAFSMDAGPSPAASQPKSTIFWTDRSMNAPYTDSPKPRDEVAQINALENLVAEWGEFIPEAHRALELGRLGFHNATKAELRVIEGDIRAARRKGARGVTRRARADLLDNRGQKRARGGASLRDGARRTSKEAWAFARRARKIQKTLRIAQSAYGDYFSLRRQAIADKRTGRKSLVLADGSFLKLAYPIAYPELVSDNSQRHSVPPYFLYSIMSVESSFHPHPVSVAHAYGLLQVIPRTGRRIASEIDYPEFSPELLLRPEVSIPFGSYYLGQLLAKFGGQELLAAAAYNGGPHRIEAWMRENPNRPMDLFVDNIPFGQSRGYARTVLEKVARYRYVYHGEDRIYVSNALKTDCKPLPNY